MASLTVETKEILITVAKRLGLDKSGIKDQLVPELQDIMNRENLLRDYPDESERQNVSARILKAQYMFGSGKTRKGYQGIVLKVQEKRLSKERQEPYSKAWGFLTAPKKGWFCLVGKGRDCDRIAALRENCEYGFSAGVLSNNGDAYDLIREDESDEPTLIKDSGTVTDTDLIDVLQLYTIPQLPEVCAKRDQTHLLKITVGVTTKWTKGSGGVMRCYDDALEEKPDLLASCGGLSIVVEKDDQLFGPGSELLVVCNTYQPKKKGSNPAEPEGFVKSNGIYIHKYSAMPFLSNAVSASNQKSQAKAGQGVEDLSDLSI